MSAVEFWGVIFAILVTFMITALIAYTAHLVISG